MTTRISKRLLSKRLRHGGRREGLGSRVRAGIVIAVASVLVAGLALTGCSTGHDQAVYGGSFTFVSPGGQTEIAYKPADRGTIGTLSGPDLMTDKTLTAQQFMDKVVVINFWGSWCPPCREEQDSLSLLSTQLASSGVQFLGVDLKEPNRTAGQDFHSAKKVPYPSIYDQTMRTILSLKGYPATAIPSTIVLDRAGRVAQIWLVSAAVPMGQMKARIAAIAAESTTPGASAAGK
ncbi:MAG: TlpA disulfide reductase family protein [Nakamurella sp.]